MKTPLTRLLPAFLLLLSVNLKAQQQFPPAYATLTAAIGFGGEATIQAADYFLEYEGCCAEAPDYFFVTPNGDVESMIFDCTLLGQTPVQLRAIDCTGTEQLFECVLLLQDNMNHCNCLPCCNPVPVLQNGIHLNMNDAGITIPASNFDLGSYSPCSNEPLKFSYSPDPDDNLQTFTCDDPGYNLTEVWITDTEANQTLVQTYVYVDDTECNAGPAPCLPAVALRHSLVIDLRADGLPTVVYAEQFDLDCSTNDCSSSDDYIITYSDNPLDFSRLFDCDDLGVNFVEIYVTDVETGAQSSLDAAVIVQDGGGVCDSGPPSPSNDNVCEPLISLDEFLNSSCPINFHNIGATAETGEIAPLDTDCNNAMAWCPGDPLENSVWFSITAPASGSLTLLAKGMDTQIALWEATECSDFLNGEALLVAANDTPSDDNTSYAEIEYAVALVPGRTYYLQVDGSNGVQDYFNIEASDPQVIFDVFRPGAGTGCQQVQVVPENGDAHGAWRHQYEFVTYDLVASVNDRRQEFGTPFFSLKVNDGPIRTDAAGNPYLDRNWAVASSGTVAEEVVYRLYFTQEEFDALAAASPTISNLDDLVLTYVENGSCDNYSGGGLSIQPEEIFEYRPGMLCAQVRLASVNTAFYLHGEGMLTNTTAPSNNAPVLYPNPTSDVVYFSWPEAAAQDLKIRLMDISGKVLRESTRLSARENQLDLSDYPGGLYLLELTFDGSRKTYKVMKE